MKSFITHLKETMNQNFYNVTEITDTLNFMDAVKVVIYTEDKDVFYFEIITDFGTYKCVFDYEYNCLEVTQE